MAYEYIPDALPRTCISLARYAYLTGYSECAINGVNYGAETYGECDNPIWTRYERDTVLYYLGEAQQEIESVTRYPLCPTYYAGEEHDYTFPFHTDWKKVLALGVRATEDVALAETVAYGADDLPATIGPVTYDGDIAEVRLFYPGSEREIEILSTERTGDQLTIYVPRCRLVAPSQFNTPSGGLDYTVLDNFLETVDVKRVYTDASDHGSLVWLHQSTLACSTCGCLSCEEHTETACLLLHSGKTGAVGALQATYTSAAWTASCNRCFHRYPDKVRANYLAGLSPINAQAENAVLRLAHAKMPEEVCGCGVLKSLWTRDTRIPDVLTSERENCPFGMSDGAWTAWKFANALATRTMSVI